MQYYKVFFETKTNRLQLRYDYVCSQLVFSNVCHALTKSGPRIFNFIKIMYVNYRDMIKNKNLNSVKRTRMKDNDLIWLRIEKRRLKNIEKHPELKLAPRFYKSLLERRISIESQLD